MGTKKYILLNLLKGITSLSIFPTDKTELQPYKPMSLVESFNAVGNSFYITSENIAKVYNNECEKIINSRK